jgi:uncharacterized OB-fold protein
MKKLLIRLRNFLLGRRTDWCPRCGRPMFADQEFCVICLRKLRNRDATL